MPQPPYLYRILTWKSFDLTDLGEKIHSLESEKQEAFEMASKLQSSVVQARNEMEVDNTPATAQTLENLKKELLNALGDTTLRRERSGNMSGIVEDYVRLRAFHHFIKTGNLLSRQDCWAYATDEEYLAGACMGLCQDLARYGMGRAIVRDETSIREARDLVDDLMQYLLDFDFQNGYLRRKYDDTKYALRTLETIMYEVNITADEEMQPLKKRAKLESTLPVQELQDVKDRIDHREDLRESLSKECKKVRRMASHAVYYLQKGDPGKAYQYLTDCEKIIRKKLLPIVEEEPPLKAGSFFTTMEDYIEAKIFYAWLLGKEETPHDTSSTLLTPADFKKFDVYVGPEQYLCGLCNFTVQLSRLAMQRRTQRDMDGLKNCLETSAAINNAILTLQRCPVRIGQRFDQLKKVVGKLERMLYEMSLSRAAGGKKMTSEAPMITPDALVPRLPSVPGTVGGTAMGISAAPPEAVPKSRSITSAVAAQNMATMIGTYPPAAGGGGGDPNSGGGSTSAGGGAPSSGGSTSGDSSDGGNPKATAEINLEVKDDSGSVVQTVPVSLTIKKESGKKRNRENVTVVPVQLKGSGDNK